MPPRSASVHHGTFVVLFALPLLVATPAAFAAGPWIPLQIGNHWEYRSPGGTQQTEAISGTRILLGRTVAIKAYTGGPDAGLVNFWDTAPDGSLLLCGFDNASAGLALAYEPPIVMLAGTPSLGVDWAVQTTAWDLSNMSVFDMLDYRQGVIETPILSVPAGVFPSFGVGVTLVPSPGSGRAALALDGRALPASGAWVALGAPTARDWYSEGVGLVQYATGDLFQLVSHGSPTPVAGTTWGAIKVRYR